MLVIIYREAEDKLKRFTYRFSVESYTDTPVIKLSLYKEELRATTRHKFRVVTEHSVYGPSRHQEVLRETPIPSDVRSELLDTVVRSFTEAVNRV